MTITILCLGLFLKTLMKQLIVWIISGFEKAKISHCKILAFVVKLALTLFHGQAFVELEFSISNTVHNNNMKEDTIMAKNILLTI